MLPLAIATAIIGACQVSAILTLPSPLRGFNTTANDNVSYALFPSNIIVDDGASLTLATTSNVSFDLTSTPWLKYDSAKGILHGTTPPSAAGGTDSLIQIPVSLTGKGGVGSISTNVQMHVWPSSLSPDLQTSSLSAQINITSIFNFHNATNPDSDSILSLSVVPLDAYSWLHVNQSSRIITGSAPRNLSYSAITIVLSSWVPSTDLTNKISLVVPILDVSDLTSSTLTPSGSMTATSPSGSNSVPAVFMKAADLSTSQKAGIAIGIFGAALVLFFVGLMLYRRRHKKGAIGITSRGSHTPFFSPSEKDGTSTLRNSTALGNHDIERLSGLSVSDDPFTCNSPTLGSRASTPQPLINDDKIYEPAATKNNHSSLTALYRNTDITDKLKDDKSDTESEISLPVSVPHQLASFRNTVGSQDPTFQNMGMNESMTFTEDGDVDDYGEETMEDDSLSEGNFSMSTSIGSRASWESISSSVRKASTKAFAKRFQNSSSGNIARQRADFRPANQRNQSFPSATRIPEEEAEQFTDMEESGDSKPASVSGAIVAHGELLHKPSIPRLVPIQPRLSQQHEEPLLIRMHSDNIPVSVKDIAD